ncbi:MAG: hypothetical protein Q9203_006855 [Teloschistes exilis]
MASIWKEDAALLGSGQATNFKTGEDLLQLFSFKSSGLSMLQVSLVASLETFPPTNNIDMNITISDLSEGVPTNLQSALDMYSSYKYVKLDGKGDQEALNATFDLVVAESGASSVDVCGLRCLLKPEGRLLLINAAKSAIEDLTQSDFSMVQTVFVNQTPIVLARVVEAAAEAPSKSKSKSFVVAYRNEPTTLTTQISSSLSAHVEVQLQQLSVCRVEGDDHVVVAADLEGPMLPTLTEKELEGLQRISQTCSSITWLSAGGIMQGSIRNMLWRRVSLDHLFLKMPTSISCIATQTAGVGVVETEYAISNNKVYISRVVPDSPLNIVYGPSVDNATLQAVEDTVPIVGHIMVLYAGLTHESIQVINGTDYPTTFPMETTGVISRVGKAVTSIAVGNYVVALYPANMARFQRFIDFGRKDVLKHLAIDIVPLHAGAQYLSFDFVEMLQSSSPILTAILGDLIEMYEAGKTSTMPPKKVVQLQDLDSAVTKFDESFASGKSVLTYYGNQNLSVLPPRPEIQLKPDGTYLLVGCLGGLGRSLTSWMLSKGARRFAFLSRSGADAPSAARLVRDLKFAGAHIDIFRGDVSNLTDVEEAVASIPSAHPVSGVIHAAMVLRDGMFHSMTHAKWHASIGPKVRGAFNLHKALEKDPLDFFSSSLPRRRERWAHRSHGLPATSIVLPMVLSVGVVAENPELEDALKRKGIYRIDESHLLQSFEAAIISKQTASPTDQLIVGLDPALLAKSVNSTKTVDGFWLDDSRFEKLLHSIRKYAGAAGGGGGSAGGQSIKGSILSAPSFDEVVELVVAHFGEKLTRLLLLDPSRIQPEATTIADYGLYSMVGAELRNWIFKNYSLDNPFQQLLSSSMTITKFAKVVVCENLGMKEA